MAWKRSSVRSRSGPPIISTISKHLPRLCRILAANSKITPRAGFASVVSPRSIVAPEDLSLRLHDEAHFPADRSSITYRKGLAALGLGRTYTAQNCPSTKTFCDTVLTLKWRKKRSQKRSGRTAVEFIPYPTLYRLSVLHYDRLFRTKSLQDLRLMVDGDHREAQRSIPENQHINQLPNQLTI